MASVKYYKTQKTGYAPLINKTSTLPTTTTYGTTTHDSYDDNVSVDTITMDVEIKTSRWTIFNLSRLLFSLIQLGLFIVAIKRISQKEYDFSENENNKDDVLIAYGSHTAFWVSVLYCSHETYILTCVIQAYSLILSIVNIYLSVKSNPLSNTICNQLNLLYLIDIFVGVIDVRSFYILAGKAGSGYCVALCTLLIDLVLITIVINETRLATTKPIITENVSNCLC